MAPHPPRSIRHDRGLQGRMAFSALLLIGSYVLVVALLVAVGAGVVTVAVVLAVTVVAHYFGSQSLALAALRARPVDAGQAPELHAAMERVSGLARCPSPRLALVDSPAPNAFTVARSPRNATICVTGGLLELLTAPQLEAVLAAELAHVASLDATVMTQCGVWAALAAHVVMLGRRLPHRRGHEAELGSVVVVLAGLLFVVSYAMVQPLARRRALSADRAALLLDRGSDALGSALSSICAAAARLDAGDRRGVCGELSPLGFVTIDAPQTVATMFPTHPPLEARLRHLDEVRAQLLAATTGARTEVSGP